MKELMKRKGKLGAAGLSLIELIVSIAILAVVGTAIGGAMYVSSRSYTRGSSEVNVQEEAQVAANLICDWLVDATAVNPIDPNDLSAGFVDSTTAGELNELWIYHPEGNDEMIIHVFQDGTDLKYDASKYADPNNHSAGTVPVSGGILASNLTPGSAVSFFTTFGKDRNVRFSMDFSFNNRTYHTATDSTSRNHEFVATDGSVIAGTPTLVLDLPKTTIGGEVVYYAILEPGQNATRGATFTFEAKLHGCDPSSAVISVTPGASGDTTLVLSNGAAANIKNCTIGCTDNAMTGGVYTFTASASNGTAAPVRCFVSIRRATKCEFDATTAVLESGTQGTTGAVYQTANLNLGLQNEARVMQGKFDQGGFAYKDPSEVTFFYRVYDDASGKYVDASSYVNPTEITSGSPSVKIELAADIPSDLYVVAVANHSGVLPNANSSYNCPFAIPSNKVTAIQTANGNATPNFTYTGVGASNQAYWDVLIVKAGQSPWTIDGGGFRRGTEAFRLGAFNSTYKTYLRGILEGMGYDVSNASTEPELTYWTVLKYRKEGETDWQEYVVGTCANFANISDYEMVKMVKAEATMFDLNCAYELKLELDVYDSTLNRVVHSDYTTGNIPAAVGSIAKYTTNAETLGAFSPNSYDQDHPYQFTGSENHFYVFFSGVDPKGVKVQIECEEGTWHDTGNGTGYYTWSATSAFNEIDYNAFKEGSISVGGHTITQVNVGDKFYTLRGYNENLYPDPGVTVEDIKLGQNCNLTSGRMYRIAFRTEFAQVNSINRGSVGSSTGSVGSTYTNHYYDLTSDSYGFIYVRG